MSSLQVPLKHLDAEIPGGHAVIFGALGMLFHDSCLSDGSTGNFYYHDLMTVVSGMLRISGHFLGAGTGKTHGELSSILLTAPDDEIALIFGPNPVLDFDF